MESVFSQANLAGLAAESTIYISFPLNAFRNPAERKNNYIKKTVWFFGFPIFQTNKKTNKQKKNGMDWQEKENKTKTHLPKVF